MAFDSPTAREGGKNNLNPMQIALNPLLSVKEKFEVLHKLKDEASGRAVNADEIGYSPEEIDAALSEVHTRASSGLSSEPAINGLF